MSHGAFMSPRKPTQKDSCQYLQPFLSYDGHTDRQTDIVTPFINIEVISHISLSPQEKLTKGKQSSTVRNSHSHSHSHSQPESAHCRAKASAWARHLVLLLLSLLQIERGSLTQNLRMSSSHCTLVCLCSFSQSLVSSQEVFLCIGCHFVLQCGLPISTCSFLFLA